MKKEILYWSSLIVLVMFILYLGLTSYLLYFDGNEVFVANNLPFPTDKSDYVAGESVIYTIDFCKNRATNVRARWSLVNGFIIGYPEQVGARSIDTGCRVVDATLKIPEYVPSGEYYLKGEFCYDVNIVRTKCYDVSTERFSVIGIDD